MKQLLVLLMGAIIFVGCSSNKTPLDTQDSFIDNNPDYVVTNHKHHKIINDMPTDKIGS